LLAGRTERKAQASYLLRKFSPAARLAHNDFADAEPGARHDACLLASLFNSGTPQAP
jgi:hypothetical protein